MNIPILLAHGVLGQYDEIIIPVVGGAFLGLLVITWWSSRNAEPLDLPPEDPEIPSESSTEPSDDNPNHYPLQ